VPLLIVGLCITYDARLAGAFDSDMHAGEFKSRGLASNRPMNSENNFYRLNSMAERGTFMRRINFRWAFCFVFAVALSLVVIACGSKVEGTYSNANGLAVLDLKSGGKATTTLMGESADCSYSVEDKQINLECEKDKSVFKINSDGSLTGPGFIGIMRKAK
jgi:hypothetical protein